MGQITDTDLICYGWIAFALLCLLIVFWCIDKWCEIENNDRKRRIRDAKRRDVIEYNRQWYAYTRAEDTRADLMRKWEELDV